MAKALTKHIPVTTMLSSLVGKSLMLGAVQEHALKGLMVMVCHLWTPLQQGRPQSLHSLRAQPPCPLPQLLHPVWWLSLLLLLLAV